MYAEAGELYLLALRLDPQNRGLRAALAQVRRMQQELPDRRRTPAEVAREQARRDAIDGAHFLGLAHLYADKGEDLHALECLGVAKAKAPGLSPIYKLEGRILARRGRHGEAAKELAKALRYNPFDRNAAELLSRAHYEQRKYRAALEAAIRAFLLLNEGDDQGAERLRRRIQTFKRALSYDNAELALLFRRGQEHLNLSFDRLQWHRERFLEDGGRFAGGFSATVPSRGPGNGGLIDMIQRIHELGALPDLGESEVIQISRFAEARPVAREEIIFRDGQPGSDLYLIEHGEISLRKETAYGLFEHRRLGPGRIFGETSFAGGAQRACDAVATEPSTLLRLDAAGLYRLVEADTELGVRLYSGLWSALARKLRGANEHLKEFFPSGEEQVAAPRAQAPQASAPQAQRVQMDEREKMRVLEEQGLSPSELRGLASFSREKRFSPGEPLFREGDRGDEMYIVMQGRVRISKQIPGIGEEALAILKRGEFFGEMALLDDQPRSADARAHQGPLTVLALDGEDYRRIRDELDAQAGLEILKLLCRLLAGRLREIDAKLVSWRIFAGPEASEDQNIVTFPGRGPSAS